MSKFIIATPTATEEQQNIITNYLKERGAWWHWFPNLWLFVPPAPSSSSIPGAGQNTKIIDAKTIRDEIQEQMKAKNSYQPFLVLAVSVDLGGSWAGMGLPRNANDSTNTS